MKKIYLLALVIIPVLFTSCKDDKELTKSEKNAITISIKDQVLTSLSGITSDTTLRSASLLRSATTETATIPNEILYGPLGGNIVMSGSYSITTNTNDITMDLESIIFAFNVTDTYNNYCYTYDGMKITLNGALNVTANCNLDMMLGYVNYNMTLKGTIKAKTSEGFDDNIDFDIVYTINEDGSGTATGTVGGEAYNEVF